MSYPNNLSDHDFLAAALAGELGAEASTQPAARSEPPRTWATPTSPPAPTSTTDNKPGEGRQHEQADDQHLGQLPRTGPIRGSDLGGNSDDSAQCRSRDGGTTLQVRHGNGSAQVVVPELRQGAGSTWSMTRC
jgi:hypothetical protein